MNRKRTETKKHIKKNDNTEIERKENVKRNEKTAKNMKEAVLRLKQERGI